MYNKSLGIADSFMEKTMCGIIGLFEKNAVAKKKDNFIIGLQALSHRGPDANGIFECNTGDALLGHTRLSIIDTSAIANQPYVVQNDDIILVFNGEIYNFRSLRLKLEALGHVFKSRSDTEVLMRSYVEWQENCVEKLEGMFAFCIYDKRCNKVLLARDISGEKPLYYFQKNNEFIFTSELKALLLGDLVPASLDLNSLDHFMKYGFSPCENSMIKDVFKLPAGCALILDLKDGSVKKWRYWDFPPPAQQLTFSQKKPSPIVLCEILENAVMRQMVADVPVGVLLSGGLDSSIVTVLAGRNKKIDTYSVIFPEDTENSEHKYSTQIANFINSNHTVIEATQDTFEVLSNIAEIIDEPLMDSSIIPTWILAKQVATKCRVALGGDGADEIFGGYKHYNKIRLFQSISKLIPNSLKNTVFDNNRFSSYTGSKVYKYLSQIDRDEPTKFLYPALYFDSEFRSSLFEQLNCLASEPKLYTSPAVNEVDDIFTASQMVDFLNYLQSDILVKIDKASMYHSLEVRSPFLDQNVINYAMQSVPSQLKAGITKRKILLRGVARELLPKNFDYRRKKGFSIPLVKWLQAGPYRRLFEDALFDKDCIFDKRTIERIFDKLDRGIDVSEGLFGLYSVAMWMKKYNVKIE